MTMILVAPLSAVEATIQRYRPSHMITLLSPEHMIGTPAGISADAHLKVGVNDVSDPALGIMPPAALHVESLLRFGRGWSGEAPLLIHCWAGISRSTAAAYILLCDRHGPGHEETIAKALRFRAPHAYPNALIVGLADAALGREGRMVRAIQAIGRGQIVPEGRCVELPIVLEDL